MKELKDLKKAGESAFLTLTAKLPADTALALFAGNSSAMRAGIEATVVSVDFEEVLGANVPFITADQVMTIGDEQILLAKYEEGKDTRPQAVHVRFDNGFTMTLGLLYQGQDKTTITFKGDAEPTKITDLKVTSIGDKLLNKRFKCAKYYRDATNPIVRNGGQKNERSYAANVYEFVETTA